MTLIVPFLMLQIQPPAGTPTELSRLRPGELTRMYRFGGLTVKGANFSLMVVTQSGRVFVKDIDGNRSGILDKARLKTLAETVRRTDMKRLTASPRAEEYSHSAYDGTDIYLSFRHMGSLRSWNNVKWNPPASFPLVEYLIEIGRSLRKS
jgi:hypothetical protein